VNPSTRAGLAVPNSYKTLAMLVIQSRHVGHHYMQANTNDTSLPANNLG